jgi:hypothetical protein
MIEAEGRAKAAAIERKSNADNLVTMGEFAHVVTYRRTHAACHELPFVRRSSHFWEEF